MKIRIKGNTVRYRLSKTEVVTLAETGELDEETEFINGKLIYAIRQSGNDGLTADFIHNIITLKVPAGALQNWAETDQVSINGHLALQNGNMLYLLLEKDFKCVDLEVSEDQSDYFENPLMSC